MASILSGVPRPAELVLSHQTAAASWGLWLLRDPGCVHVTVPRNSSRRQVDGARVHRADLASADVVRHEGVRMTTAERTTVDLARVLPLPEALAVVDSAVRFGGVGVADLQGRARSARGPGSRTLIRAIALADPGSESFLESYCRGVLVVAGLAPERTQHWIRGVGGRRIARVDFAWPSRRVIVEVDGFAFHADRSRYRIDRRRINALALAGWLVLRFSWEDVIGRPEHVVACVRQALYGEAAAA